MRIILVMQEPPLPFGSAPARWYYILLKTLVVRGYDVKAFATCSKIEDIPKVEAIFPAPEYNLRCYPSPTESGWKEKLQTLYRPYSRIFNPQLYQDLDIELKKDFDILHLEQLWCGWLGLKYINKALLNVHHLILIDQEHIKSETLHSYIQKQMMFSSERRLIQKYKYFRSCSPRLVDKIHKFNPNAKVETIPVGLDLNQYTYIPNEQRTTEPIISLIGNMSWYPGFSAAERLLTRLWPAIKQQVPNGQLQIVGWSAKSALSQYINLPDVTIEENVKNIQPYFERTSVFLYAPARGSGMKIKILEALAFGIPVVTTSEGSEGLPAEDGVHAAICDEDEGLISRTVKLLKNPELQNQQRLQGRKMLERHCNSQVTVDAIEKIYHNMLNI
ncbi:glycosyltransferase family 4 protein [Okeanomitos corallinicola TIOX110]|uniref:Glycosyltransferase family 4 protein n=1 Tax=Okeanomitos corallinicola TIOX110 TaxID=3133117 RepID=A0ABZ2UW35_9CYAN